MIIILLKVVAIWAALLGALVIWWSDMKGSESEMYKDDWRDEHGERLH